MPYSNNAKTKTLNNLFRSETAYICLYISNPTELDVGTEVTGGAYARQVITYGEPTIAGDEMLVQNTAVITFPVATSDWGLVTHYGIRDALTGGNLIQYGTFTIPQDVVQGNQPVINVGESTLRLK